MLPEFKDMDIEYLDQTLFYGHRCESEMPLKPVEIMFTVPSVLLNL